MTVPEFVGLPDCEAGLIAWLKPRTLAKVATQVPNPRPDTLVTVQRIGGVPSQWQDRALILVQCWAPTEPAAWALASNMYAYTEGAAGHGPFQEVRAVSGVMNFPDPATRNPRFQFTVQAWLARPII